jgi:hypothetical protein
MGFLLEQRRPRSLSAGIPLEIEPVITRRSVVAGGSFAPGHLGELTQLVPFEMVDDVLATARKTPAAGA